MSKIALVGSGNIGGTMAFLASYKNLWDIVLIDIVEDIAEGKALDIRQASALTGFCHKITGSTHMHDLEDADVVIVTAGIQRKPEMKSRSELLLINGKTIREVAQNVRTYCPNAFVIVITNPLDAMVWLFQKESGLPVHKVVGMAGVLDSSRFRCFLAEACGVSASDVDAMVIGGHGDSMLPLLRHASVGGVPLSVWVDKGWVTQDQLNQIVERTRKGGAEIFSYLKTGSAFYAPAACAIEMAQSYLEDEKRILPCAAFLDGEYGLKGLYIGVPVVLGRGGVEKIIELPLENDEKALFDTSVHDVRQLVESLAF